MNQAEPQFYKHHVFFCVNQRTDGRECCADKGAEDLRGYAKAKIKALKMSGEAQCRINNAGCLDRCDLGPIMVVYPEGTWYTYIDQSDIDEIVEEHLVHGRVVERLKV